jgi:Protein of unknown function (DUF1524)/Protein of unknown function DUF262
VASWRNITGRKQRVIAVAPSPFIELKDETLGQLFSGAYVFHLPYFQRSYAWTIDNVARLIGDLVTFLEATSDDEQYYLGTLMLGRRSEADGFDLVDGHQRLMTFTILFAVLRDLCTSKAEKAKLQALIESDGYHLRPQHHLADFCRIYVQEPGATKNDPEQSFDQLSDTERGIITNRDDLRQRLSENNMAVETRSSLISLLTERCRLGIHIAPNADHAWARLNKEEETRLTFNPSARSKASLLSLIAVDQRQQCSQIWDSVEELLGRDGVHHLLAHLRCLKARKLNYAKPLDEEIAVLYGIDKNALQFMQSVFAPAAKRFDKLQKNAFNGDRAKDIAEACDRLSWIDRESWVPAALLWMEKRGESGDETATFFSGLERLVWAMKLAQLGPEKRIPPLNALCAEIENGTHADALTAFKIGRKVTAAARENLQAVRFDRRDHRVAVLRRLALASGQRFSNDQAETFTVEHILPQSWTKKNDWRRSFPGRKEVEASAHRLGNLTWMEPDLNNEAGDKDLRVKQRLYAKSEVSITNTLCDFDDWTADDITKRTETLTAQLFDHLGL